jgi:murein DD-endopeptidase MepM/ murein hydrolase activator NlpD
LETTAFFMDNKTFRQHLPACAPVVPFAQGDQLLLMDFTAANTLLTDEILRNTAIFSAYVADCLQTAGAKFGIGGYLENRTVYSRSKVFDGSGIDEEPRRLHLGIDVWGGAGTPVSAPLDGSVHSFAFNDHYGDYGATIILQHELPGLRFHSLYGHLSLRDLDGLYKGKPVKAGEIIAHFGEPVENGHWPPHLHFQLILDMEGKEGDYPGVCRVSERDRYEANCPDPDGVLDLLKHAVG